MKQKIHILILNCIIFGLVAITMVATKTPTKKTLTCLTKQEQFVAGTPISIFFKGNLQTPRLFLIHSFGKTILDGQIKNDTIQFTIPVSYTKKTGLVSWFLLENKEEIVKGSFSIIPNNTTRTHLESYLGPPSTLAGDNHFVMFVTIPTDDFDNPKASNTAVAIQHQFLKSIEKETVKTKNFIAWKNVQAPEKSGTVLIASQCHDALSKEFDAVIYPSIATDFNISYTRNHEFADGNQITIISTSPIKDKFGNMVSNGTLVSFLITNNQNMILKTFGTTINGIAEGQILHPEQENEYTVTAYINGISKSNSLQIKYLPITPTITYSFSNGNRTILVGPIKSFMDQLVPDGIKVNVNVYHDEKLIAQLTENSNRGMAKFQLPSEFYTEKTYSITIESLGKTIKINPFNVSN
ncbi:hypothetical protein [Flavobacterium sp. J27]|uniref:hypothetical protein n=1 Tax=Flavobacterium sp. J27 TaxID=2060419 RepID=UPI00102FBC22|nr:hypothetical protein [Flavobacterium sp. J27]